jgi:hypothetical protein
VWEEVHWMHLAQDIGQKFVVLLKIKNIMVLLARSSTGTVLSGVTEFVNIFKMNDNFLQRLIFIFEFYVVLERCKTN